MAAVLFLLALERNCEILPRRGGATSFPNKFFGKTPTLKNIPHGRCLDPLLNEGKFAEGFAEERANESRSS